MALAHFFSHYTLPNRRRDFVNSVGSHSRICNRSRLVSNTNMVLSSSQQLVMAFTAVLLVFVLFPRMFSGGSSRDGPSFEPRSSKRGSGMSTAVLVY